MDEETKDIIGNKKLYLVTVSFSFPALADNEDDALDYVDDAMRDTHLPDCASAELIKIFSDGKPEHIAYWEGSALVYCKDGEVTLEEAVEHEKVRRHNEEMMKKQGNLF